MLYGRYAIVIRAIDCVMVSFGVSMTPCRKKAVKMLKSESLVITIVAKIILYPVRDSE